MNILKETVKRWDVFYQQAPNKNNNVELKQFWSSLSMLKDFADGNNQWGTWLSELLSFDNNRIHRRTVAGIVERYEKQVNELVNNDRDDKSTIAKDMTEDMMITLEEGLVESEQSLEPCGELWSTIEVICKQCGHESYTPRDVADNIEQEKQYYLHANPNPIVLALHAINHVIPSRMVRAAIGFCAIGAAMGVVLLPFVAFYTLELWTTLTLIGGSGIAATAAGVFMAFTDILCASMENPINHTLFHKEGAEQGLLALGDVTFTSTVGDEKSKHYHEIHNDTTYTYRDGAAPDTGCIIGEFDAPNEVFEKPSLVKPKYRPPSLALPAGYSKDLGNNDKQPQSELDLVNGCHITAGSLPPPLDQGTEEATMGVVM